MGLFNFKTYIFRDFKISSQAECWYPAFIIFNQKMRMFSTGEEKIRFDIVASEQVYLRRKEVYWHRSSLEARNAEVS